MPVLLVNTTAKHHYNLALTLTSSHCHRMTMGQHLSVSVATLHYDTERSNFVLIVVVGLAAVAVMAARVGAPQPVHHFCFLLLLFAFFSPLKRLLFCHFPQFVCINFSRFFYFVFFSSSSFVNEFVIPVLSEMKAVRLWMRFHPPILLSINSP